MKYMFPLRWKPNGVLSGVSLGIMIHPPDSNGRPLLAFDCRRELMSLRMVSEKGTHFAKQQQKRTYQTSEWVSSTRHAPKPNSTWTNRQILKCQSLKGAIN